MPVKRSKFGRANPVVPSPAGFVGPTDPQATDYPLIRKLASFKPLSGNAIATLVSLHTNLRTVASHRDLIVEGTSYGSPLVLIGGTAIRYKLFPDGRRQIIDFILPGDIVGLRGSVTNFAVNSVSTVEDCVIATLDVKQHMDGLRGNALVWENIFWLTALEHMLLTERIVILGRATAFERLGYFFLELWERLNIIGNTVGHSFVLPLTEHLVADSVGLSPVHISRTLKRLRDEGLADMMRGRVVLHDVSRLAAIAHYEMSHLSCSHCGARLRPHRQRIPSNQLM